ncbi:hypothetical protein [Paraclostridium bifermentans]|uniref:hypothetical protein n=1 Tax=Paraclostridium bifermentans TaxID=1490 RepID=UPI00115AD534|nr:hypothetical protein [Paraclostridium bifermentans]TQO55812.1 hypothetical protein D5S05_16790 [Paraclostridium bifermentans]
MKIIFTNSKVQNVGFKIGGWDSGATLQSTKDIQLQEGTVATPYTPYQETRCDIKLPCQLEKWDRLYFDREEDAWCVDKNMAYTLFNGSENWVPWNLAETTPNPNLAYFVLDGGRVNPNLLSSDGYSNQFEVVPPTDVTRECMSYRKIGDIDRIYLAINKSKANNISELKTYLKNNNLLVKYLAKIPQKIVLPQSEQIKLNSFANKTHIYTISGDVDAIVKATVSKSLASTVQANTDEINILNGKIEDIQGLKESQDFAYETDKGYLVCKDTQNGVVKDLKIYGKSLVNLVGNPGIKKVGRGGSTEAKYAFVPNLIVGKTYTLIFDISDTVNSERIVLSQNGGANVVGMTNITVNKNGHYCFTFNAIDNSSELWVYYATEGSANINNVLVLEGDHTQNPPNSYWVGIASVGNNNGIEVLSRKEDGNLFNGTLIQGGINGLNGADWNVANRLRSEYYFVSKLNLFTKIESDLFIIGDINTYDLNMKFLKEVPVNKNTLTSVLLPINTRYVRFTIKHKDTNTNITPDNLKGVPILFGYSNFNYALRQDKKTILFKDTDNTWKPITNVRGIDGNNCDIVDSFNNKFIKKYGVRSYQSGDETNSNVVTDMTNTIYKLDKQLEYEINPIYPSSYDNETMILINSGAIAPHASWKITSSLPNFVKELSNQIKQLQEQVYKTNVANFTVALNALDTKLRLDRLEAPVI